MTQTPAAAALLDRCVEYLTRAGIGDASLREIAAGVGTSHRMLLYHFGSREGLLAAVVGAVEDRQRTALADLAAEGDDLVEVSRAFWQRLSDPALAPAERLFFEVYAQALYARPGTETFRETVIASWEGPLSDLFERRGRTADDARRRARLGLAAVRGLLLDLLLTGDRETVDAAAELVIPLLVGD